MTYATSFTLMSYRLKQFWTFMKKKILSASYFQPAARFPTISRLSFQSKKSKYLAQALKALTAQKTAISFQGFAMSLALTSRSGRNSPLQVRSEERRVGKERR